jgi:DNA-binding MarR family transcriptional regulator
MYINDCRSYSVRVASRRTAQTADGAHGLIEERATSEGLLLALVGQHAMRRLRAAHTEHKLSPRQFHLLGLLHDRGALTQRELGALMDVGPSILVTLLNPLEADGYLSRERDPTDRRRHVVTITRRGEEQLERAAQAQRDAEDELFAGFTDPQRAQLRGLLLVLRQRLTPNRTPPAPLPTRQSPAEP